jgi:hypothetical protein
MNLITLRTHQYITTKGMLVLDWIVLYSRIKNVHTTYISFSNNPTINIYNCHNHRDLYLFNKYKLKCLPIPNLYIQYSIDTAHNQVP